MGRWADSTRAVPIGVQIGLNEFHQSWLERAIHTTGAFAQKKQEALRSNEGISFFVALRKPQRADVYGAV